MFKMVFLTVTWILYHTLSHISFTWYGSVATVPKGLDLAFHMKTALVAKHCGGIHDNYGCGKESHDIQAQT